MMMFFSNLWRVFRKRTFINVLFWIFHFRFEKNDSLHFTSLHFRWRPPCLIMRGYGATVVEGWDILRAYMVRGIVLLGYY
jgi:hypothetical protein